jgi:hypothetical protein
MFRAMSILVMSMIAIGGKSGFADTALRVSRYSYAAIAYNPETGKYGYAYNYRSRVGAESEALRRCPGEDSRIVCWVNRGFCVLALGNDPSCYGIGYSYADGAYLRDAQVMAIEDCAKRTDGVRIVVALSSDGQYQYEKPIERPKTMMELVEEFLDLPASE